MAAKKTSLPAVEQVQDSGKAKALETTLANLNKKFGDGVVMKLGEATKMTVEAIPSGSLSLDLALGDWWRAAWPRDRNLWAGKLWEDDRLFAYHCRSAKTGRHLWFY